MKLIQDTGKVLYCGKSKRPQYVFFTTNCSDTYVITVEIDGTPVKFYSRHPYCGASTIVSFEFNDDWYYISDSVIHDHVYNNHTSLLLFTSYTSKSKPKLRVKRRVKLAHMFDGQSQDLIGNSEIIKVSTKDCTVRSMMEVLNIPYDDANKLMAPHRTNRKGCVMASVLATYFSYKFEIFPIKSGITIGTFAQNNPKGRYIVLVDRHALAVVHGQIRDHTFKPGRKIKNVFMLKESQCPSTIQ